MFSKKSLPITIAFILMLALGTMGLAYGAWTDQLVINGNVTTGTLNVDFLAPYLYSADMGGALETEADFCTATLADDLITINIPNGYPGYQCNGSIFVKNVGTIPAKIQPPVLVSETLPAGWDLLWADVCWAADTILPVGLDVNQCDFAFEIPYSETGNMGQHYSFSYRIDVTQP